MNENLKKFIEEAGGITLTGKEKQTMRAVLEARMGSVEEPNFFNFKNMAFAGTFAALILVSSVSAASRSSIPGDILYNLKLTGENVREALTFGEEAILQTKTAQVIERLGEAEKLSITDQLDPVKEEQIQNLFVESSNETLDYIASTTATSIEKRESIKAEFKNKLESYKDSLNKKEKRPERLLEKVDSVIARLGAGANIATTTAIITATTTPPFGTSTPETNISTSTEEAATSTEEEINDN